MKPPKARTEVAEARVASLEARILDIADDRLGLQHGGQDSVALLDALDADAADDRIHRQQAEAENAALRERVAELEAVTRHDSEIIGDMNVFSLEREERLAVAVATIGVVSRSLVTIAKAIEEDDTAQTGEALVWLQNGIRETLKKLWRWASRARDAGRLTAKRRSCAAAVIITTG